MLLAPDIKLIGVGVTDADGYVEPGVSASRKLIDRFNQRGDKLEVAKSDSRAVHQFPEAWRVSAFSVDHFPILNEKGTVEIAIVLLTKKATHHGHAIFACPRFDGSDGLAFQRIRQASDIHREAGGEGFREDS